MTSAIPTYPSQTEARPWVYVTEGRSGVTPQADQVLLPLLRDAPETEQEGLIASLLEEHAAPIIRGILKSKLSSHAGEYAERQEAEDLYSEVVVQLLARLRIFIASPQANSISDFGSYVAVTTYNTCHLYLRRKYPARWHLKNRLRYALTNRTEYSLWQTDAGEWFCGLAAWRDSQNHAGRLPEELRRLADDPGALKRAGLKVADVQRAKLVELLPAVFRHAGAPIRLDELLSVVADLQGVHDRGPAVSIHDEKELGLNQKEISSGSTSELELRSYLRRLWNEIIQLPPMQRTALLLNLRDDQENVIALLPLAGIATVRQIARTVSIPAEQFAEIWNKLPLDDKTISAQLGLTRQQVINLRKSARARLARRMKLLDEVR